MLLQLAAGTYDVSGAGWPFDLGATDVAVEIAPVDAAGGPVILDAKGLKPVFVLSLPTNLLTLRDIEVRNAVAAALPAHGGAVLVAAGRLDLDGVTLRNNTAFGQARA